MIGFLVRALGLLPLSVLYAIGRIIAFVAFRMLRWHVPLARRNLEAPYHGMPEPRPAAEEAAAAGAARPQNASIN